MSVMSNIRESNYSPTSSSASALYKILALNQLTGKDLTMKKMELDDEVYEPSTSSVTSDDAVEAKITENLEDTNPLSLIAENPKQRSRRRLKKVDDNNTSLPKYDESSPVKNRRDEYNDFFKPVVNVLHVPLNSSPTMGNSAGLCLKEIEEYQQTLPDDVLFKRPHTPEPEEKPLKSTEESSVSNGAAASTNIFPFLTPNFFPNILSNLFPNASTTTWPFRPIPNITEDELSSKPLANALSMREQSNMILNANSLMSTPSNKLKALSGDSSTSIASASSTTHTSSDNQQTTATSQPVITSRSSLEVPPLQLPSVDVPNVPNSNFGVSPSLPLFSNTQNFNLLSPVYQQHLNSLQSQGSVPLFTPSASEIQNSSQQLLNSNLFSQISSTHPFLTANSSLTNSLDSERKSGKLSPTLRAQTAAFFQKQLLERNKSYDEASERYQLLLRMKQANNEKILTCSYCLLFFREEAMYKMHAALHHPLNVWMCSLCGMECNNRLFFNVHIIAARHEQAVPK